jgi:hypothetical protein
MQLGQKLKDSVVEQLSTESKEFRNEFLSQKAQIAAMLRTVTLSQNHPPSPFSPVACSIRGSFLTFQRSGFRFCGSAAAFV